MEGKPYMFPEGVYNVNSQLYFGVAKTKLQGAGMWYSQINFTVTNASNGGLRGNAPEISYSDLHITTDMTTRTNGYGGIIGVYTKGSVIKNIWVEHCATGAWIGQYTPIGPEYADGFLMTGCRFRNTYADGINLCKGTRNAIVEHCNFRNNGDDAMAIWSADGLECINNTYRYNTAENGWRAAGAALYGGKDNKFYKLIIKDNIDVGITITNTFSGVGFNENGMHDFHDIVISACGTFNATYNDRVGAINIYHAHSAGTKIQNIRMYNIDINDSKCDGIRMARKSGDGIFNLVFENININNTGTEYPFNNVENDQAKRGYAVIFDNYPRGGATYCNLQASNLGGNSDGEIFSIAQKGSFRWNEEINCEVTPVSGISLTPAETSISGGDKIELIPIFSPDNATNRIVNYYSENPSVASVNYNGEVTGMSKGETSIIVTSQDGNYSAESKVTVTSNPVVYYRIKNRWQNTYLFDAGDRVKYNAIVSDDTYLWKIVDSNGVKQIVNSSTGDFMHINNQLGFIQCTSEFIDTTSSGWSLQDAGDDYVRIKSEMTGSSDYIHIENLQNQAQYGGIEDSWWSAMWILEPVLITSLENYSILDNLELYPNPSRGNFKLKMHSFAQNENISVSIFNLFGQIVFSEDFTIPNKKNQVIHIKTGDALVNGNYYVIVSGKSKQIKAKLVIIK